MEKAGLFIISVETLVSWGYGRLAQASRNSDPWLIFSALLSLQSWAENHMLTCSLLLSGWDIDCRGLSGKHHGNTFALAFLHSACRMGVGGAAAINTYILSYPYSPLPPFLNQKRFLLLKLSERIGGIKSRRFIVYPFPAIESWYTAGANTAPGSAQDKKNLDQQNLKK